MNRPRRNERNVFIFNPLATYSTCATTLCAVTAISTTRTGFTRSRTITCSSSTGTTSFTKTKRLTTYNKCEYKNYSKDFHPFLLYLKSLKKKLMTPRPIFCSSPRLVVGTPVCLATLPRKADRPIALFHDQEKPNLRPISILNLQAQILYEVTIVL